MYVLSFWFVTTQKKSKQLVNLKALSQRQSHREDLPKFPSTERKSICTNGSIFVVDRFYEPRKEKQRKGKCSCFLQ